MHASIQAGDNLMSNLGVMTERRTVDDPIEGESDAEQPDEQSCAGTRLRSVNPSVAVRC